MIASSQAGAPLEVALQAVGSNEEILAREQTAFEAIAGGARQAVVFGCGYLGRLALDGAQSAGLDVLAMTDNNPALWGQSVAGVPVLSPQDALQRYNERVFFVAAVYNGTPVRRQLEQLGCRRIVPYPRFFWQFSRFMPGEDRLELPHRVLLDLRPVRAAYDTLFDHASRVEFAAQIRWRCLLDYGCLPPPRPPAAMYFDDELVRLDPGEVLADCGAFDGDSIRLFLDKAHERFRHIYALEPDARNRAALEAYLATLPAGLRDRISVLPFGVSDRTATVAFDASATVGSRIGPSGTVEIECRSLDDLLQDPAPTFIKMDIEGAEPAAIAGATATIRRSRPILAVCAYHKCDHLWSLPLLLHGALPEYRLYLRRYAEECWETVYYAVPPERA